MKLKVTLTTITIIAIFCNNELFGNEPFTIVTNKEEYNNLVLESNIPVLVTFSAQWCKICNTTKTLLTELINELAFKDKVRFVYIDIDTAPELSEEYKIDVIPTFKYIHKKIEYNNEIGVKNVDSFKEQISQKIKTVFNIADTKKEVPEEKWSYQIQKKATFVKEQSTKIAQETWKKVQEWTKKATSATLSYSISTLGWMKRKLKYIHAQIPDNSQEVVTQEKETLA